MRARAQPLLPLDLPDPADRWIDTLSEALNDPNRHSGFLSKAEAALAACPGNGAILTLAATAALLDQRPEKAFVFLKRFSKRYQSTPTHHLLLALAFFQSKNTAAARSLLEEYDLAQWYDAFQVFPAGQARFRWLAEHINAIMGRGNPAVRRPTAAKRRAKSAPQPPRRPQLARQAAPEVANAGPARLPPPLPQIAIDIPCRVEVDLAPLVSAIARQPEQDGRWWELRERFAHLGLAQPACWCSRRLPWSGNGTRSWR
jgi:hypothetical protein